MKKTQRAGAKRPAKKTKKITSNKKADTVEPVSWLDTPAHPDYPKGMTIRDFFRHCLTGALFMAAVVASLMLVA